MEDFADVANADEGDDGGEDDDDAGEDVEFGNEDAESGKDDDFAPYAPVSPQYLQ